MDMQECNCYHGVNHPLVKVPGRDIDMDAIHAQKERCRVKGCRGTSCCANLSTMSLNAHERMHTCMVDDASRAGSERASEASSSRATETARRARLARLLNYFPTF